MHRLAQIFWGSYLIMARQAPENLTLFEQAVYDTISRKTAPEQVLAYLHTRDGHIKEWDMLVTEGREMLDARPHEVDDLACRCLGSLPHEFADTPTLEKWMQFMEETNRQYQTLTASKHPNIPEFPLR